MACQRSNSLFTANAIFVLFLTLACCLLETCFPPLSNSFHSHNHQPFALLCQAQEGEETNQKHQEQQEDIGQPPAGKKAKTVSLRGLTGIPGSPPTQSGLATSLLPGEMVPGLTRLQSALQHRCGIEAPGTYPDQFTQKFCGGGHGHRPLRLDP